MDVRTCVLFAVLNKNFFSCARSLSGVRGVRLQSARPHQAAGPASPERLPAQPPAVSVAARGRRRKRPHDGGCRVATVATSIAQKIVGRCCCCCGGDVSPSAGCQARRLRHPLSAALNAVGPEGRTAAERVTRPHAGPAPAVVALWPAVPQRQ